MTENHVRIGLIGLGAIGHRVARAFSRFPAAEITFVCDTDPARTAAVAQEFNVPHTTADYRALIASDQVDLVYIGVPPRRHRPIALAAMAAGKHIFCEKPLALTLAEAEEMAAAARTAGVVNAVNLSMYGSPGLRTFFAAVKAGAMGDLRRAELNLVFPQWPRAWQQTPWIGKREQGGPIREVGPHMFDVILRAFGPVARVRADMEYPAADPEACESGAFGALELAGGQVVTVSCLANLPRPESVTLTAYGSSGSLGLVGWDKPVAAQGDGPLEPMPPSAAAGVSMVELVLAAVRGEAVTLPDFAHGLAIQRVLDAWERSAAGGGGWVTVGA